MRTPADIDEAHELWGASCGPCAVAALLERDLADVRDLFPSFPGWTTPSRARSALQSAGLRAEWTPWSEPLPCVGLALIQIEGPWRGREAYRHTHWIACRWDGGYRVFDVNNEAAVGRNEWLPWAEWSRRVMPAIVAEHEREFRGVTGWRVLSGVETDW